MNRDRMIALANAIERAPHDPDPHYREGAFTRDIKTFNMEWFVCGTTGCIAGWTLAMFAPERPGRPGEAAYKAREILGLTEWQAELLFFPANLCDISYAEITPQQAAAVIRDAVSIFQAKKGDYVAEEMESAWNSRTKSRRQE